MTLYSSDRLPLWVLLLILIKDVLLIAGAAVLWKKDIVVQAEMPGKLATVFFAAAFAAMFLIETDQSAVINLLFVPAGIMAVVSFLVYLRGFIPQDSSYLAG